MSIATTLPINRSNGGVATLRRNLDNPLQALLFCRTEDSNTFAEKRKRLVGDICVAAAFVSYCGPFNAEFREKLRKE